MNNMAVTFKDILAIRQYVRIGVFFSPRILLTSPQIRRPAGIAVKKVTFVFHVGRPLL
jgi:hypothetical protein